MTTTPSPAAADTTTPQEAAATIPQQSGAPRAGRSRAFTNWIVQVSAEDPGARSALRSGLRKDLNSVRRMHRLVAPWLPEQRSEDVERAYYTIAAMIAAQPRSALTASQGAADSPHLPDGQDPAPAPRRRRTSLGTAFATAVTEGPGREKEMRAGTAESRLNLLTRQSVNGLHRHLPASVGYLRALGVNIDWDQLLDDLANWRKQSGRISRTWLQDFYRERDSNLSQQADKADEKELAAETASGPTSA
ncbi:type I-E CRISPR-associated protein Cse2/CasB [Streptomyces sp. NBC_01174]|uniref:type I-E CRISPR-associated protein Cse2/CasB n=1 Tax=Streptomyces sp. NBC_01174 TaxID=2903758 RepID=UPI002F9148E4|nr:type I-E CRISPR-associated protein Cse2/CasB [Streptomyces sp. NBC_01174]